MFHNPEEPDLVISTRRLVAAAALMAPAVALVPTTTASAVAPPDAPVFISEIHYDNAGTDVGEAIEVFAPAGTDLSAWSLVLYNGANGAAYSTTSLGGAVPDLGGGAGVLVVDYPSNGIQNGSPDGVALVDGLGAVRQFLSYEGALTAVGGPADGLTSTDIGVAEAGTELIGLSLQLTGTGSCAGQLTWNAPMASMFGALGGITPDPTAVCDPVGGGGGGPTGPTERLIHEIQGTGETSPLVGERVVIEGIVVGDEEGPSPALRGFFVQEEDADADGDPSTSEGIFVFNFDNDQVDVGDLVLVEGTVTEFVRSGSTAGLTELTDFVVVTVLSSGNQLPMPAIIEFPVTSLDDLEASEGMAVTFPQELVVAEYFNYDRFGDVTVALPALGQDRPYTPTAVYAPGDFRAAELADLNLRSRITIDDGITTQNPTAPVHPINRELFT
ncbi:MAG: hypothetical protein ABIO83_03945, partial [Ilumatobacteraceae bacterium]